MGLMYFMIKTSKNFITILIISISWLRPMNESTSLWPHLGSSLFVASVVALIGFHHNDKTNMKAYGSKSLVKEGRIYFNHSLERQN
jgi:hypothetical protein